MSLKFSPPFVHKNILFLFFFSLPNPKKSAKTTRWWWWRWSRARKNSFFLLYENFLCIQQFRSLQGIKNIFFISRIAFFIFSLMRIFHFQFFLSLLFTSQFCMPVCAITTAVHGVCFLKSQKNSHSPFPEYIRFSWMMTMIISIIVRGEIKMIFLKWNAGVKWEKKRL